GRPDEDRQDAERVDPTVLAPADHRASGRVPVELRLRLHVRGTPAAQAVVLPPALQASGAPRGPAGRLEVSRPETQLRCDPDRPRGASEGDPGAARPLDDQADIRSVWALATEPR